MIEKHAKAETVTIVTPGESGQKILVKGTINTPNGKPVGNALVYFYQTSNIGMVFRYGRSCFDDGRGSSSCTTVWLFKNQMRTEIFPSIR